MVVDECIGRCLDVGSTPTGAGFEIGFKPGISFNLTDNFSLVAHYGFLGYRTKYNGSSVSGLSLSGNEISLSLYYCF